MKKFVSMYQPTNSKSFYSAINQNKAGQVLRDKATNQINIR